MAALGTVLAVAGTVVSAVGTIASGAAQQRDANYQAAQLDVKAGEERAASQRDALQLARNKRLALSTIQARASASGFGANDPTVLDLTGETAAYGTYQEQMTRYGGESRAQGDKDQAVGLRAAGKAAMTNAYFTAAGTIAGGLSDTMFKKYGSAAYGGASTGHYG